MEYRLVMAKFLEFDDRVNSKIKEGWEPIGGIAIERVGFDTWCYQAMIKK